MPPVVFIFLSFAPTRFNIFSHVSSFRIIDEQTIFDFVHRIIYSANKQTAKIRQLASRIAETFLFCSLNGINIDLNKLLLYNKIHQLDYSMYISQQFSKAVHHSDFML